LTALSLENSEGIADEVSPGGRDEDDDEDADDRDGSVGEEGEEGAVGSGTPKSAPAPSVVLFLETSAAPVSSFR